MSLRPTGYGIIHPSDRDYAKREKKRLAEQLKNDPSIAIYIAKEITQHREFCRRIGMDEKIINKV